MKAFFIKLVLFSVLLGIVDYFWNQYVPDSHIPHPYAIIGFFVVVTVIFHAFMLKNAGARPQVIVRYYMTGTVLRLFLYLFVLLLYRFVDKPTLVPFAVAFLLHYFAFTFFEVSQLIKKFKNPS